MRSKEQRIAKYKAKTDPATVRPKRLAMFPIMTANYAPTAYEAEALETAVRDCLVQEKVVLDRFYYLNFARELGKCKKKYSGATLVFYAQSKKDRWLARGLDDRVLRKLASVLFSITLT